MYMCFRLEMLLQRSQNSILAPAGKTPPVADFVAASAVPSELLVAASPCPLPSGPTQLAVCSETSISASNISPVSADGGSSITQLLQKDKENGAAAAATQLPCSCSTTTL